MPERTHHKHKQLVLALAFEIMSLVDAAVQPLLYMDIPIINFLPHVHASLHLYCVH